MKTQIVMSVVESQNLQEIRKPSQFLDKILRVWLAAALLTGMNSVSGLAALTAADPTQSLAPVKETTANAKTVTPAANVQKVPPSSNDFLSEGPLSAASVAENNGRSLYVSTSGNNSGDGTAAKPFATIEHAVSQLEAGDTLHIAPGTYRVNDGGTFANSGTADKPIKIIGDGNVVIDGTGLFAYTPVFDTGGKNHLHFQNLTVQNSRAAVQVTGDSSNVLIDGLKTNNNQMAVIIDQGSYVTVKNGIFANSRNAVVANNTSHHLMFENIEAYGSQDIYEEYENKYRNGDGFIMNLGTHDVVFRNIIAHDNWDAGIDTKAVNTLIDNVTVYSNKNNFKVWADTVIQNSLSYGARILTDDPVSGEGNGLNARTGNIKIIDSTFVNNANNDIQVDAQGPASNVSVENSIFYRNIPGGSQVAKVGGKFADKNSIFYWAGKSSSPEFTIDGSSKWVDPQFVNSNAADLPALTNVAADSRKNQMMKPKVNLNLKSTSPAINKGNPGFSKGNQGLGGGSVGFGSSGLNGTAVPLPVNNEGPLSRVNTGALTTDAGKSAKCEEEMCGIKQGETVRGTLHIKPNPGLLSSIHKVAYYLDGDLYEHIYTAPYAIGGSKGLDTTNLENGTHLITGFYSTSEGDVHFRYTFDVTN